METNVVRSNCGMCHAGCGILALVKDGKMEGFEYDFCKGCGICAEICPVKCIKMEKG